ncbi:MAG: alpha-glucan family phosphorylase [Rikenellaceae bacterium]|nr:alpha-glucan family phosphorylase [Rikenellaceae bacterium]
MSDKSMLAPDYLFEVSWEVCNKVGGIHTVIATKALNLSKELQNRHILIGPDVWRDTHKNPEFNEDNNLLRAWRVKAADEGLRIRVGRWNVAGRPIAILVDFSSYITKKDEILTEFWTKFKLDSITGQWDYIESALFGYACGKVIESYVRFNLSPHHKVVAQFHEWMTGAGVLYLNLANIPVATVFTTHATVVGRCISGNNLPLYGALESYVADDKAREFNVMAKHSLEKTAAQVADVFTTVSEVTARECKVFLGKNVDLITPNGFENSFTPSSEEYKSFHKNARITLNEVATLMTGCEFPEDTVMIAISGRYEYKNKGIDLFLDTLSRLNRNPKLTRGLVAWIFVPSGNNGPNKELVNKMTTFSRYTTNCTHMLNDPDWDPVVKRIRELHLQNKCSDKVKVLFVPAYLNGNDGVFDKTYYQLLAGLDLTLFPSYYEPWGYTPLESLAFSVPTVTTSLAGFGLWVKEHYKRVHPGIDIVERTDTNYDDVISALESKVIEISKLSKQRLTEYRHNAKDVSEIALWENQIRYYKQAYSNALGKIVLKNGEFPVFSDEKDNITFKVNSANKPSWSTMLVNKVLPDRLKPLETLAKNLWWSWNEEAKDLFKSIDIDLWRSSFRNPLNMMDNIPSGKYAALEKDADFLERMDRVFASFNRYISVKGEMKGPKIAYFSMEYGLDSSLKIYSGGLGILAGDYLKESSDKMVPITGVGLLYKYGYFTQRLSAQGDQIALYDPQNFMKIPVTPIRDDKGNWITIGIALPGRTLYARLWRVDIGRTELILMDTDFDDNLPEDRPVTFYLYGGDWENRLKQELLLGIGGILALRALNKHIDVYHCNEGHAAFIGLERLREYIQDENLSFNEAVEVVRSSSLFTTHTPVPAGHDSFSEDLLREYIPHFADRLKISWETMMSLGKIDPVNPNEKFSMSNLASNLSQEINGVSMLHGEVSREILSPLWPGYLPEELHVSYVTNGVHYPTWTAGDWKAIFEKAFGAGFSEHIYDKSCFEGIYKVPDQKVWEIRNRLRERLMTFIRHTLSEPVTTAHYRPQQVVAIKEALRSDVLTIGFARRFATYKRASLLFRDLERLSGIVNSKEHPVQFVFAGKAHPADKAGQDLIKRIIEVSLMPQFIGKIIFIPGYDMGVAKILVQGVDVWMNTPTRPLEASGTSGEKAAMNGVMHFSVLDGWWVEGYKEGAGWALSKEVTYDDPASQDELDAATIYNMIETEIAPLFYNLDKKSGLPLEWIRYIKNTIAQVASNFTTHRMMEDYQQKFYNPLSQRNDRLVRNDYAIARDISYWKKRVRREWPLIEVKNYIKPENSKEEISPGNEYFAEVELMIGDLTPEDIGVEMVFATKGKDNRMKLLKIYDFDFVSFNDGIAKYRCQMMPETAGVYNFAGRVYAKHLELPYRQDFDLVKWL